jgi:hypothetical protein
MLQASDQPLDKTVNVVANAEFFGLKNEKPVSTQCRPSAHGSDNRKKDKKRKETRHSTVVSVSDV